MRYQVATFVVPTLLLGGCSLLYNPSSIDKPASDARMIDSGEVAVDVEVRADAMPLDLTLTDAYPPTIYEGTGTGTSRAGVVVVRGHNLIKDAAYNLQATLVPATAGAVTLASFEASGNGDYLALVVTAPVVDACHDGTSVAVGVSVTQSDGAGGTVTRALDNAFSITCLDELKSAPASADDLKAMYSVVEITGALDFPAATAKAALIRSASSITIGGAVDASAMSKNPGPGGAAGGATNLTGSGPRPGVGVSALGASGGGAGFLVAGTAGANSGLGAQGGAGGQAIGDTWVSKYEGTNTSSGGGGGGVGATGAGGVGGGGGGTLELTAPGDISVGALTANGAAGAGGAGGGGDGGAGTGGVIVVRAGNTLTTATVAVTKGGATGSGASSDGRVRIAAAKGTYPTGGTPCTVPLSSGCNVIKGPMFVDVPVKTSLQTGPITLRGLPNDASSTMRVFDRAGNPVDGATYAPVFGTTGNATLMPTLKAGYNNVCVWVAGAAPDIAESVTCQEIAFLPP